MKLLSCILVIASVGYVNSSSVYANEYNSNSVVTPETEWLETYTIENRKPELTHDLFINRYDINANELNSTSRAAIPLALIPIMTWCVANNCVGALNSMIANGWRAPGKLSIAIAQVKRFMGWK